MTLACRKTRLPRAGIFRHALRRCYRALAYVGACGQDSLLPMPSSGGNLSSEAKVEDGPDRQRRQRADMAMNEQKQARWLREFEELGTAKVRDGMILGRWEKEKRSVARQWLQQHDVSDFLAVHPVGSAPGTFIMKLKRAKWWVYAAGGILAAMVLARLLRRFL